MLNVNVPILCIHRLHMGHLKHALNKIIHQSLLLGVLYHLLQVCQILAVVGIVKLWKLPNLRLFCISTINSMVLRNS